jgi:hypothetical protein
MAHSDFVPAARPRLTDVRSCESWLAQATLADSRQACDAFLSLLDEMGDAPPRHAAYLQILECLRPPIRSVQEEHSKRFAGKPLPLGHVENTAFVQARDLWIALMRAYRRLARAASKGKPELAKSAALLCQRALHCAGELVGAHFAARRECGAELWHELYEIYSLAEKQSIAGAPITEGTSETNCTAVFVRPLMLALAHPFGLAPRELSWARRWIARWAPRVLLTPQPGDAYGVDLSHGAAPSWLKADREGESLRRLDFSVVGQSIRKKLRQLEEGADPSELGLGNDYTQPAMGELLQALAAAWLEGPRPREFQRRPASNATEIVAGFEAIHRSLSGESTVSKSTASPWEYTRRDADQMAIFQRAAKRDEQARANAGETWDTMDQSATGFRVRRKAQGARITLRQIVALRPHGAKQFILSEVRWLSEGSGQSLTIGTQALPGLASGCSVRPASSDPAKRETASPAFLLPATAGAAPTLVLPTGWYQQGRAIEITTRGKSTSVKLSALIARGYDYDCVNFSATT